MENVHRRRLSLECGEEQAQPTGNECLGRLMAQDPHKARLRRIDRRLCALDQQSNLAIRPVDFGFTRLVGRGGPW